MKIQKKTEVKEQRRQRIERQLKKAQPEVMLKRKQKVVLITRVAMKVAHVQLKVGKDALMIVRAPLKKVKNVVTTRLVTKVGEVKAEKAAKKRPYSRPRTEQGSEKRSYNKTGYQGRRTGRS